MIVMVPLIIIIIATGLIPQPSHSHLVPASLQSTSRHHDQITSVQTFRDILQRGSEPSDTPKHQESDTAPQKHSV